MANKVTRIVNANGTISFNNSQTQGFSNLFGTTSTNTANLITAMPIINVTNTKSNVSTHSWPKRHSHRCGIYHYHIKKIYQRLDGIEHDITLHKQDPTTFLKYWSDHEVEIFMRIKKDLADLYNNRFVEYKKMIAEEKGYDISDLVSTTKFKLK